DRAAKHANAIAAATWRKSSSGPRWRITSRNSTPTPSIAAHDHPLIGSGLGRYRGLSAGARARRIAPTLTAPSPAIHMIAFGTEYAAESARNAVLPPARAVTRRP